MSTDHSPSVLPESVTADQAEKLMAAAMQSSPESTPTLAWTPPSVADVEAWFPDYAVEALIGRGAMGAVYRAVQNRLGRTVAIKLLPAELAATGDFAARFEREARAMAQLSHPNIVAVHDFGRTAAGHGFIVMEYVEGADLSRLIQEAGTGLTVPQALTIVGQICDALQYAHGKGCIHRDVKPQNVLVDATGRVKIADFGLAKLVGGHPSVYGYTATGAVLGTPEYVAPEQLKGGAVDHRADIYSLGVMFYEMLTGDLPRGAWEPPSERVPAADNRLDEVVRRAMQREPDRRYQQCSEVKTDVTRVQAGPSAPAETPSTSRSRVAGRIIGVLLLAVAYFASRLTPTRDFLTVLWLAGPFTILAAAFFLWRRPIRWWGGLMAGLAVLPVAFLLGTMVGQDGLKNRAFNRLRAPSEASRLSNVSQKEIDATLGELSYLQSELPDEIYNDGSPLEQLTKSQAELDQLRISIDRVVQIVGPEAPGVAEMNQRWELLKKDIAERIARFSTPEALAAFEDRKKVEEFDRRLRSVIPKIEAARNTVLFTDLKAFSDVEKARYREIIDEALQSADALRDEAAKSKMPELLSRTNSLVTKTLQLREDLQRKGWDTPPPAVSEDKGSLTLSDATQAEVSGLLDDLLNAQEELDGHRGLEGDEFQPGTVEAERTRLASLRQRVGRLTGTLPDSLPAKREIAQRLSQVERDVEKELAALRDPERLARLASKHLEQLTRNAMAPAGDPFAPGQSAAAGNPFAPALSASELDHLVSDYGVAPTDPRLVKLRGMLAQQQELPELAGRITNARNKLVEATNAIQNLRWDKLEPEQRATLTERWNAVETEADALRKHRRAIDVTELPSLINALEYLQVVRPDKAAASSESTPQ